MQTSPARRCSIRPALCALPLAVMLTIPLAAGAARSEMHARAGAPAHFQASTGEPTSAAARCAREFIAMVNTPTPENVRNFETAWASKTRQGRASVDERVPRVAALQEKWGKVTVSGVAETKDKSVVVSASGAAGVWMELSFKMSASEAGKLDAIEIEESNQPIERRPLTPEVRVQTAQGVADALRTGYVFPDKGAKMADTILANLKAGEYDAIESESALAMQITEDCRKITKDMHLGVRMAPRRTAAPDQDMIAPREQMARENFLFRKTDVLDGNIGYVRLDGFVKDPDADRAASEAMAKVAGCDAIIFDMRFNGGGNPEMVQYLTSYLFESKTHLNDMVDRDGKVVEEYWTLTDVPGPRPKAGVPVFVLTSSRTFSGAEEFCYNLKNLKRATIVGETTGGGAHPVREERVNERFLVRVPFMRAQNPISKTNWEGVGVEPDVKVAASAALDKALELARATKTAPSPAGAGSKK